MSDSSNEPIHTAGVYNEELLRHFRQPLNAGTLDTARQDIVRGEAGRARDGCHVRFYLQIDAAGRVVRSRYRVYGCPVAIAACSLVSTHVLAQGAEALAQVEVQPLVAALEPPAAKRGVLLIIEDALRAAAENFLAKHATDSPQPYNVG